MIDVKLFSHNQEAYNNILQKWYKEKKACVIHATGTGKSMIMLKIINDFEISKKLVLAPSNHILSQLENLSDELPNTELMTYAKLIMLSDEELKELNPDIIMFDEFHRCGAETWGNSVEKLLKFNPHSYLLGLSATPIRYLDNERNMADELFEGNIVSTITLPQAIGKGILPIPKYVMALYTFNEDIEDIEKKIGKSNNSEEQKKELYNELNTLRNNLDKSKGIPQIIKKHITNKTGKYVVFCKNKAHLNKMKPLVNKWFKEALSISKINNYILHSDDNQSNKQLKSFIDDKSETLRLIFSIEMLNEGIHAKDIDGVILLRPTQSPIIYHQQIGRAMHFGQKQNPLILDLVNNINNLGIHHFSEEIKKEIKKDSKSDKEKEDKLSEIEFLLIDETIDVQDAFRNLENRLLSYWDYMYSLYKEFIETNKIQPKCNEVYNNENLGSWCDTQSKMYKKNILEKDKYDKLITIGWVPSKLDAKWQYMLKLYAKYIKTYTTQPTGNCVFNGENLGCWIQAQRKRYNKGLLSSDEYDKLISLGWELNPDEKRWNYMYDLYEDFVKTNKRQPSIKEVYNLENLGNWCSRAKEQLREGKLDKIKLDKLTKLGWVQNKNISRWNYMYLLYKEYVEINKKQPIKGVLYKGERLTVWLDTQKENYLNATLDAKKYKLLTNLGWTPKKHDAQWTNTYNIYKEYLSTTSKDVTTSTIYKSIRIGVWRNVQRTAYKKGTMSDERQKLLKEINIL